MSPERPDSFDAGFSATLYSGGMSATPSMRRVADEITSGLQQRGVHTREVVPPLTGWLGKYVGYPLVAPATRADLFHVLDHSLGHAAALLPKKRTIITCHDLFLLQAHQVIPGFVVPRRHLTQFRMSTRYLQKAAAIITISAATKQSVIDLFDVPPDRIDVARLGVDSMFRQLGSDVREQTRAKLRFDRPAVFQLGTAAYKNVPAVLQTLARVRDSGVDAMLVRVGAPLDPEQVALADELGLAPHVRELGRVSDGELVEVLNAADAMIFPSLWEGMGWPPIEAMACGLPVVASNTAAVAEMAEGAALLADPHDIAALSDHLGRVLTEPGLAAELRTAGLARAKQFTWASTIDVHMRVYKRVLDRVG